MQYKETKAFQKDFKKLKKKFQSLALDFEVAKLFSLEAYHLNSFDHGGIETITKKEIAGEMVQIHKLTKFACKALKNRGAKSGIRIIYAYQPNTQTVTFIEIYFKADKANEDKDRIKQYLKG